VLDKIAVILSKAGEISSLEEGETVCIYRRADTGWEKHASVEGSLNYSDAGMLRNRMGDLIRQMGDCKIIAGKSVSGLPYHLFNHMGFFVFEIKELSDRLLDQLLADVQCPPSQGAV
jgi:hypothetical protein